jgi:prepilin-type N-terminal cleavage/methylation domain-containing protein
VSATLQRRVARRAFTLIEVMVAMVVFSLVMASLFVSFRTAVRSYDIGITHAEGDQSTRFAVTQITDDLHNIYYLNPNKYNVHRRQREAVQNQREQKLLKSGFKSGEISDEPGMEDLAPPIDLAFRATDGDKLDDLSFVRYQTLKRGEDRMPWGLARIRYFINDNTLYRAIEDIQKP